MNKQLKSLCKGALSVDKIHAHFSHRDIHVHYTFNQNSYSLDHVQVMQPQENRRST